MDELALFPLGIVALPGEWVPLHIFEDRYRTMIAECVERESEFGILWSADEEPHRVGCACLVDRVLETLEDGRMNILTRGTRPFRLLEERPGAPYRAGVVEFLHDAPETIDPAGARAARELYANLVEQATDERPEPEDLERMDAYGMAATVDFGPEAKQQLLELRSENERMQLLAKLLRSARRRLEMVSRAQERARSNGKVRFG